MKLINLLFLALIISISSCGGNDDEVEKEGNCLTAEIDGDSFTAETTTATFVNTTIEYENLGDQETRILTIIGTIPNLTSGTRTINITFACSEFTSDLDYVESDSDCGIAMNYQVLSFSNPSSSLVVNASEGGVNIQEVTDDKIRGTFTFKGEDQDGTAYNITNGFFDTTIE